MIDLIIDLGANDGADLPYYLMKAKKVVAVEANLILCEQIRSKYRDEITNGRLQIENVAVTVGFTGKCDFYLHKVNHGLSQMTKPYNLDDFERIEIDSLNVIELIEKYVSEHNGFKYYLKVDLENYDKFIIKDIFEKDYFPHYLSVESHDVEVMSRLIASEKYSYYNIVEGSEVEKNYRKSKIQVGDDLIEFTFPAHSAGPFGDDIAGGWFDSGDLFRILGYIGMGWRDIHATSEVPKKTKNLSILDLRKLAFISFVRQLYKSLINEKVRDKLFTIRKGLT
jgi:FkbM family methyltransferase